MLKMKHYRLVSIHPKHFRLKDVRDGKEFSVAKHAIAPEMHDKIASLPKEESEPIKPVAAPKMPEMKLADGGEVSSKDEDEIIEEKARIDKDNREAQEEGADPVEYPKEVKDLMAKTDVTPKQHFDEGGAALPIASSPEALANTPVPPAAQPDQSNVIPDQAAVAPQPYMMPQDQAALAQSQPTSQDQSRTPASMTPANQPPQPGPMQGYGSDMEKAIEEQRQGILGGSQAMAQGQAEAAKAYKAQQDALMAQQNAHNAQMKILNDRQNQLFQDASSGKIDPNHYWADKGTGGKIGAAVAIALGGLGGGLSGRGGNMALDVINKAIDRDIEAQKSNLQQKNNLYNMNLNQTQSELMANTQTKLDALTMAQAKVNQAMSTAQSGAAKAEGQKLLGGLDQQIASLKFQLGQMNATNPSGPSPQSLRAMISTGMIPKEQSGTAIKELGDYQKMQNVLNQTDKVFDTAVNNATYSNEYLPKWMPTVRDKSRIYDAVANAWLGNITKDTEGRVTPADLELMKSSLPTVLDRSNPKVYNEKLDNIKRMVQEKYAFPTLSTYNLIGRAPASQSGAGINFTPMNGQ